METDSDVIGGRLTVRLRSGKRKVVTLDQEDAYELLEYAQKMRGRRKKSISLEAKDRMIWGMHTSGMSTPVIAEKLGYSQETVKKAIGRVLAGRYQDRYWCKDAPREDD
jgi:DNA-binding NarL/FixJ family response regulator